MDGNETVQRQEDGEQKEKDPPHMLEKVNKDTNYKVSSAVKEELNAAIDKVKSLTGVNIGKDFGDTVRSISSTTTKVGADNFSWHKTGRAVDFNQGLKWVIAKDPSGEDMYFRLYLKATNQEKEEKSKEGEKVAVSKFQKNFTGNEDLLNNPYGKNLKKYNFIDVSAILEANDFKRIKAHKGWEKSYNKREWWHYENRGGNSMYNALKEIYTEEQIINGYKKLLAANRHKSSGRLTREGFPERIMKKMITPIDKHGMKLYFSVGANKNAANIYEDMYTVKAALQKLGHKPFNGKDDTAMVESIKEFQKKEKITPDGWMSAGGTTHIRLGKRLLDASKNK